MWPHTRVGTPGRRCRHDVLVDTVLPVVRSTQQSLRKHQCGEEGGSNKYCIDICSSWHRKEGWRWQEWGMGLLVTGYWCCILTAIGISVPLHHACGLPRPWMKCMAQGMGLHRNAAKRPPHLHTHTHADCPHRRSAAAGIGSARTRAQPQARCSERTI